MKLKFISLLFLSIISFAQQVKIKVIETTDTHGAIYPFDFVNNKETSYSLANFSTYLTQQREDTTQEVVLLSGGDLLQGTPAVYYYNFEETSAPHLYAEVMNYLKYDAGTVGNHDIETGHKVYDSFREQLNFPWLAANAVKEDGITPYFEPYTIIQKKGIKIAVLGLITPHIPYWLPEKLYKGMEYNDMIASAKYWVNKIKKEEKPDILIGLFHAGADFTYGGQTANTYKNENASLLVAREVPGFDVVFVGHDHHGWNKTIINSEGKEVLFLGGTYSAKDFAVADLTINFNNGVISVDKKGYLLNSKNFKADEKFLKTFEKQFKVISDYVSRPLAKINSSISTRESFFGDSPFIDLIHQLQLQISNAQISFTAPLSFDAEIEEGNIYVRDMFKLYRYENFLYTINLTGKEIDAALEYSYALWFNQMKNEDDHLLNFNTDERGNLIFDERSNFPILKERFYNFESAEGITYTVDVSKPEGERVEILKFNNGSKFYPDSIYTVAVSSYRGNGGGGHLTKGAGLTKEELTSRRITSTEKDLRYFMMKWIEKMKEINPVTNNNWEILPKAWVDKAKERDYKLLFDNKE